MCIFYASYTVCCINNGSNLMTISPNEIPLMGGCGVCMPDAWCACVQFLFLLHFTEHLSFYAVVLWMWFVSNELQLHYHVLRRKMELKRRNKMIIFECCKCMGILFPIEILQSRDCSNCRKCHIIIVT